MKVIYLHGFASSGNSSKSEWLRQQFGECDVEFLSPDLPNRSSQAIAYLDEYLAGFADQKICLIGTSLGGFFAAYYAAKYGWPAVLINPLADVQDLISSAMGENTNYATGEHFVMEQADADALLAVCDAMQPSVATMLLLLDKGDEILDYRKALKRYGEAAEVHLFEGGSHRFEHLPESMPNILALLT